MSIDNQKIDEFRVDMPTEKGGIARGIMPQIHKDDYPALFKYLKDEFGAVIRQKRVKNEIFTSYTK